jgi:hypothetical protein
LCNVEIAEQKSRREEEKKRRDGDWGSGKITRFPQNPQKCHVYPVRGNVPFPSPL